MKAIIFDMDGVLINSIEAWRSTHNLTLKHFKKRHAFSVDDYKNLFGKDTGLIFKSLGLKEWAQMENFAWNNFHHFKDRVHVDPNAVFVLQRLKDTGLKIALVSGSPRNIINDVLDHYNLTPYFDITIAGDEVSANKPNPEGILKACRLLGIKPKDALYVGDTLTDVKASEAAGTSLAAITTSLSEDQFPSADFVASNLLELLKELEDSSNL